VLLISPSSFGRNTLVNFADEILSHARANDMVLDSDWGSLPAFYQGLADNPLGLFMWLEFSIVQKKMKQPSFAGLQEWLTDRYDSFKTPNTIRYRKTGKPTDTPEIHFSLAPRINLLATSSFDWFTENLTLEDSTGGFMPRWIVVSLEDSGRQLPIPEPPDPSLVKPLAEHLKRVRSLNGPAEFLDESEALYRDWYSQSVERAKDQPNPSLAKVFRDRQRAHVLKLAVVYEVSRSATLTVSPEAMRRAIWKAEQLEQTNFKLLSAGMSKEGARANKMAEMILKAGVDGLSLSDLTHAFSHLKANEREDRILTLVQSALIYAFKRRSKGRPRVVLVHQKHIDSHRRKNSHEQELGLDEIFS
jgi:hypothetical protein